MIYLGRSIQTSPYFEGFSFDIFNVPEQSHEGTIEIDEKGTIEVRWESHFENHEGHPELITLCKQLTASLLIFRRG